MHLLTGVTKSVAFGDTALQDQQFKVQVRQRHCSIPINHQILGFAPQEREATHSISGVNCCAISNILRLTARILESEISGLRAGHTPVRNVLSALMLMKHSK